MQFLLAAGRTTPGLFIKHLKTKARPPFAVSRVSASADSSVAPPQRITSTGNAFVKHCVKLRTSSKYRLEAGAILLVGSELLQEAAGATADARLQVRTLILGDAEEQQHAVGPWLVAHKTVVVTEPVMRKIVGLESAASIDAAAEIDLPRPTDFVRDWPQVISSSARDSSPTSLGSSSLGAAAYDSVGAASSAGSHADSEEAGVTQGVGLSGVSGAGEGHSSTSHESSGTSERSNGSDPQRHAQGVGTHGVSTHGVTTQGLKLDEEQHSHSHQADGPSTTPLNSSSSSVTQGSSMPTARASTSAVQPRPLRRLLALDGVQDPGNLGTLIRSALAFGWDGVFLMRGCCSPFNDKAIKSSRGAVLRVAIGSGTLSDLLQVTQHHGLHLIAADPEPPSEAQPLQGLAPSSSSTQRPSFHTSNPAHPNQLQAETHQDETHQDKTHQDGRASHQTAERKQSQQHSAVGEVAPPPQGVCLVLGSEGHGLSSEASAACTPVAIPMAGRMESLNVGIAGGILMWALSEGGADKLLTRLRILNLLQPLGGKS